MKTIWMYFAFLLIFQGCTKDTAIDQFSLNSSFDMKTGSIYSTSDNNLSIKIKEIFDSRCPIGVVCVWAGEVTVNLEVNDGTKWYVSLTKTRAPIDTLHGYIFTLVDVLPYPKHGEQIPDEQRTVVLQVVKL